MTHPAYIREKAIEMRREMGLTIDEIAERLGISRQTIYSWVNHIPIEREYKPSPAHEARDQANSLRYKALRDEAYEEGREMYDELIQEPGFRDFVCMYIGEGFKRSRNAVSICNSSLTVMILADIWTRRFAKNKLHYSLQYHADQDPDKLRRLWGEVLDVDPEAIVLQRKSNSRQLHKRTWRSRHGVLTIRTGDTYFRARLQAWMDRLTDEWLDLPQVGA